MMTSMRRGGRFYLRLMLQDDVSDAVREMCTRSGTIFVDSLNVDVLHRRQGTGC